MALLSIPLFPVLSAALGILITRVLYEYFISPLRHFPGPLLAKLTDFYRAGLTHAGNVDSKKGAWHRRSGTAVRIGPNAVSIDDPDLIKVIYTSKNPWMKSNMYRPNDVLVNGQRIQNIFNTQDHAFNVKYKSPIGSFWTMTKILELEPLLDETLSKLVDIFTIRFADKEGTRCMMNEWSTYFSWDAVANVGFGRHYGFMQQGQDVGGIIAESTAGLRYFAPVSQIPWLDEWLDKNPIWRIGPRPLVNGFLYTVQIITEFQQQISAGTAQKKQVNHFLDKYNGLKGTIDFVDDNQVINWLMINVLAGGDSTAGAIRSPIYHLGRNPNVQAKLIAELDAANLIIPAQWKDIKDLSYLNAVVLESQRISPAVGLMLERVVPEAGFELPDGRNIPTGTKVGINPCVVTRNTSLFGNDVEKFRPERWLRLESQSLEAVDLMFGAGTRVCMGKHLAKVKIFKLLATLYTAFDMSFVHQDHEWKQQNSWFMYQTDIPMLIRRRRWN